jgi:hypothetical protein
MIWLKQYFFYSVEIKQGVTRDVPDGYVVGISEWIVIPYLVESHENELY